MKLIKADLLDDVVSSYDQTKTTIQGRVFQKVISGSDILGPPISKFIDIFTDTGATPVNTVYSTSNGRLFSLGTPVNGTNYDTLRILLYDFDHSVGTHAYVGYIEVNLPNVAASVHTIRSFKAIDTGTTGWKIFITTTATVTINGGTFLINNIDKADFIPIGAPNIPVATGNNQKASYLLQDPSNIGVNQLQIASAGSSLDIANNRIYVHNGVSATHQFYVYDTSITPTYSNVSSLVLDDTTDTVSDAGHTYNNNDPVFISNLVGGTGINNNTVYFVRNVVPAVSYQLSATSGGAAINITTPGTATIGRAWGTTGSNFVHKTGNLPALTGTLLSNDSEDYALPVAAPLNGGVLNGNSCVFFATSTNLYLGLLSDLTSGAVTWSSLTTSNALGTINQVTAVTVASATWSNVLDSAFLVTNAAIIINKKVENSVIQNIFGNLGNTYYEGFSFASVDLSLITMPAIDVEAGWLFALGVTAGQRGIIAVDLRSDASYDYSYIVTKVLNNHNGFMKTISTWEKLYSDTGNIKVQYRNSGFGSISGGWIDIPDYEDLSTLGITSNQIQFKILFRIHSEGASSPAQLNELLIGLQSNADISDKWEFSDDHSDNTTPSRIAFRLKEVYSTSVPTLYFRAYDLSDALLVNHNTVTNIANFEYSTDNGFSWIPMGTIPNTVGTLLRYTFTSAPGVPIRPGLRED